MRQAAAAVQSKAQGLAHRPHSAAAIGRQTRTSEQIHSHTSRQLDTQSDVNECREKQKKKKQKRRRKEKSINRVAVSLLAKTESHQWR